MDQLQDRLNKLELKCQLLDATICELKPLKQKYESAKDYRAKYYHQRYLTDPVYREKIKTNAKKYYLKKKQLKNKSNDSIGTTPQE